MPTVGRVMAKTMKAPLREVLKHVNDTSAYMKPNGALTDLGKERFKQDCAKYDVKSTRQLTQKLMDFIIVSVKLVVSSAEKSKKELNAERIGALEKLKSAILPLKQITEKIPEEMQKLTELTNK